MKSRYTLSPEGALDLAGIWHYIRRNASVMIADRVERVLREKMIMLAAAPGIGHWRHDLTDEAVKFFPVYSYLIVYLPMTKPLQIVAILHGRRDVERLLKDRL